MIRQYLDLKAKHKDEILFFRLGDFYEMFFDEAVEVSRILNLTLTKRVDVPMCGVPYHASKVYIARLLRAGKKVAICEQVTEPVVGGLAERKVIEVITPGTVSEEDFLEQGVNNYLAAIYCSNKKTDGNYGLDYYAGFAYIDVTTGSFFATSFPKRQFIEKFVKELGKVLPKEILIQQSLYNDFPELKKILLEYSDMLQNTYPDWSFNVEQAEKKLCLVFGTENLKGFSLNANSAEVPPAALIIKYLEDTSEKNISHIYISGIKIYTENDFVSIDDSTRKNLELIYNLRDNTSAYTLFETLNYTCTSMGQRLLRRYINYPLNSKEQIEQRLEKVDSLYCNQKVASIIRENLSAILDIERLTSRIAMNKTHGKDLLALKHSLEAVLKIYKQLVSNGFLFLQITEDEQNKINSLYSLLDESINEECTISLTDGKLIKKGFSEEADRLKSLKENAHEFLEEYLSSEKKATGITNLKIKYNRMMGYFLEVSLGSISSVPDYFIRQRSLANADRFVTEKLKKIEDDINSAEENLIEVEKKIFSDVCQEILKYNVLLKQISEKIAELDVSQSFARSAILHSWTKPILLESSGILNIINGRHPVVEAHLPTGEFVPNSILLCSCELQNSQSSTCNDKIKLEKTLTGVATEKMTVEKNKRTIPSFALITGPNMAGKSTFLRQTALITLLAQIGSFVPAELAEICPVDKIFCRVGATDNLARGESTFLVEMTETAYILNSATKNSLVIMDEVGRGTSTQDGLAIAQSVSEYLLNSIGAKTLFATHYHELIHLKNKHLINLKLDVLETDGKIVFLKKVTPGAAENSYGLHVAGLAGIPKSVLQRAENLLYASSKFKNNIEFDQQEKSAKTEDEDFQLCTETQVSSNKNGIAKTPSFFSEEEMVIDEILSVDPNNTTPIEALQLISRWKKNLLG